MSAMELDGYYREELSYLHDLAREFARANPESAHLLAEPGSDPDVERLLEGVAFLSARLRAKLDDQLPELTQSLVEGLWPQLLRPAPAMCVVAFEPLPAARQQAVAIPAGVQLEAEPVADTRCRFTTCWPLKVLPLRVADAQLRRDLGGELRIAIETQGAPLSALGVDRIRVHLHGEPAVALGLRHALTGLATDLRLERPGADPVSLGRDAIRPVGFADDEAILPEGDRSLAPLRLLQEWFCYRDSFCFVDLVLGPAATAVEDERFELVVPLSDLPDPAPPITAEHLRLNCVPALNCFPQAASPIELDYRELDYRLVPGDAARGRSAMHSVTAVSALPAGGGAGLTFRPAAHRLGGDEDSCWYQVLRRHAVAGRGQELFLALSVPPDELGRKMVLSVDGMATNGELAARVGVGELRVPTTEVPATVRFANITRPSAERLPPLGAELHWRYVQQLDLHHHSIADRERFCALLDCYDLPALVDQRERDRHRRMLEGIESFSCRPAELTHRGAAVPGLAVELVAEEDPFGGEGGLHGFASVLDRFLALYASINAATQLTVQAKRSGRRWTFPARSGELSLL